MLQPSLMKRVLQGSVSRCTCHPDGTCLICNMALAQAQDQLFDTFNVTKSSHESNFPKDFGCTLSNKNPGNYHGDVEQAAFLSSSLGARNHPSPKHAAAMAHARLSRCIDVSTRYRNVSNTCEVIRWSSAEWEITTTVWIILYSKFATTKPNIHKGYRNFPSRQ